MSIKSVKYMERRAGEVYEFLELTFEVGCDTVPLDQELALCKEYADAAFAEYKKKHPISPPSQAVVSNQRSFQAVQQQRPLYQAPQGQWVTQEVNTGIEVPKIYWDKKKVDWKDAAAYLGSLVPQYKGNFGYIKDPATGKYYILVKPRAQKPQNQAYQPPVQPQQDFSGMPDHAVGATVGEAYDDDDMPF